MWVRVWLRPGGALGLESPVRRPGLVDIYCTKSKDEKNEKTQSSFYHGIRHKAHFGQVKKTNPGPWTTAGLHQKYFQVTNLTTVVWVSLIKFSFHLYNTSFNYDNINHISN